MRVLDKTDMFENQSQPKIEKGKRQLIKHKFD